MKIQFRKLIIGTGLIALTWTNLTFAAIEDLIPTISTKGENPSKVTLVNQLPQGGWLYILPIAIKLVLSIAGPLAFVSCVVGGVMMVTGQGDDEKIRKGKYVLLWSILALIIIAASYAIVTGVTQLQLIQPK